MMAPAGAIATELSRDALKVNPFIPIVLLWVGTCIRDRSVFSERQAMHVGIVSFAARGSRPLTGCYARSSGLPTL
jgi:hypothetical protein